jgi:hypothetical protein
MLSKVEKVGNLEVALGSISCKVSVPPRSFILMNTSLLPNFKISFGVNIAMHMLDSLIPH